MNNIIDTRDTWKCARARNCDKESLLSFVVVDDIYSCSWFKILLLRLLSLALVLVLHKSIINRPTYTKRPQTAKLNEFPNMSPYFVGTAYLTLSCVRPVATTSCVRLFLLGGGLWREHKTGAAEECGRREGPLCVANCAWFKVCMLSLVCSLCVCLCIGNKVLAVDQQCARRREPEMSF